MWHNAKRNCWSARPRPKRVRQTAIEVEIARAIVARKEGALSRAELALSRAHVVAPISETVGRPHVAPGAFVEAKAGTVLAELAQLDPILWSIGVDAGIHAGPIHRSGRSPRFLRDPPRRGAPQPTNVRLIAAILVRIFKGLANFDSEMQRFESRRPSHAARSPRKK